MFYFETLVRLPDKKAGVRWDEKTYCLTLQGYM